MIKNNKFPAPKIKSLLTLVLAANLGLPFGPSLSRASALVSSQEEPVMNPDLIDKSIDPCEDFFQYSCGNWIKKTPLPGEYPSWYRFSMIDEQTRAILKGILEGYAKGQTVPSQKYSEQLGAFYSSCMNESDSDKMSRKEIQGMLKQIDKLAEVSDIPKALADLHLMGVGAFFNAYADQDPGNATRVIAQLDQGGLGLPEKAYYLEKSDDKKSLRAKYINHIEKSMRLAGLSFLDAKSASKAALKIETQLAKISFSMEERRDPKLLYNLMNRQKLSSLTPSFQYNTYFKRLGSPGLNEFNVGVPKFFKGLDEVLAQNSFEDLKFYLKWQLIYSVAPVSFNTLILEDFDFNGRILNGQKEPRTRWKKCLASVDSAMGEALGEAFVKVAFTPEAKALSLSMVQKIIAQLHETLESAPWMDQETKKGAISKLGTFNPKIGYPEVFRNYDELKI